MSEFWSGDLGLTLVTISVAMLIFVITPLREAGLARSDFFRSDCDGADDLWRDCGEDRARLSRVCDGDGG